jgi:SPP1 family phage portal protein
VDANLVEQMKQTGVLPLGPEGDVGFITKTLDDTVITNHLKRLEQNVMRFAKSVDFGSDAFGGALPVIAYKIKVAGLEHKCKTTEMKTRAALRYEYTLLSKFWATHGVADIDPLDVRFTFTRNLPANIEGEMNVLRLGTGLVSQKTLFSLMSFIKDPEEEMRRMEEDKEADKVDLDSIPMPEEMNAAGNERSGEAGDEGDRGFDERAGADGTRQLSRSFGEDT